MMRFSAKVAALALIASASYSDVMAADDTVVYQRNGDCVNTYILRMLVKASHSGKSNGEFDGHRMMMRRLVIAQQCQVEMRQFSPEGVLEERKFLLCRFDNPLEE